MAEKASWPVLPIQEARRPDLNKLMPMLLPHEQIDWQQEYTSWIKRLEKVITYLDEECAEVVDLPTCVFMELRELAREIRDAQTDRA